MLRIIVLLTGLLCVIYACNNDLSTIGQEVINNNNYIGEESYQVSYTATVKADSFVTSSGLYDPFIKQLAVGKYTDRYSGLTVAIPCFQVTPTTLPTIAHNAVLDSITLHFQYGGNMWGDTLYQVTPQTFHLYQLKELPELDYENDCYFYNNQAVDTAKRIASCTFYPLVTSMAKAYFKVDQALGEDLFQRMIFRRDKADDIYNNEPVGIYTYYNFLKYFKGLAIVPDENNNCLMTIEASSDKLYLEFHYSSAGENYTLQFPLAQREYQYNQILNYPTETFTTLTNQQQTVTFKEVKFALTQGLCGYMTKMTLPSVPLYDKYMTIVKAQLEVKPEFMYNNPIAPPSTISVYRTNELNQIMGLLYNNNSSPIVGKLVENELNTDDTRYIFDMTEYYQALSAMPPTEKNQQILLGVPNNGFSYLGISFDQMIVREEPILRVYYAKYK